MDPTRPQPSVHEVWLAAVRAFDAWDHETAQSLALQLDPEESEEPIAHPAPMARLLVHLLRAQLHIRSDRFDEALAQLAGAHDLASRLGAARQAGTVAMSDDEWNLLRAELALAVAYVDVNLEQVHGTAASVEAAWRAAETVPEGFLGDRLRVRSAILFGSWLGQVRNAPGSIDWFERAAELAGEGALLPLGLQARCNAVSVRIELARALSRDAATEADAAWQAISQGLETLQRHHDRLLPYLQGLLHTSWVELWLHEGRPMEALERATQAMRDPASLDQRCTLLNALAQALAANDRLEEACLQVDEALEISRRLGLMPREDELCELGADLAYRLGHEEREVDLLRRQRRLRHDMHMADARRRAQLCAVVLSTERARREAAQAQARQLHLEMDNLSLQQQAEVLSQAALRDPLTGVANRRAFDARLAEAHARIRSTGHALCLAWLDVDHFKRVNDQCGHATGDAVLKRLADILSAGVRPGDLVARLGGEEFAVVFARATWAQALEASERLRLAVQQHDWHGLTKGLPVTVSIGLVDASDFMSPAEACQEADRRLYAAKRAGRNRLHALAAPPETQ